MNIVKSQNSQVASLVKWFDCSLTLDAFVTLPTEQLYNRYLKDLRDNTGSLGVKPKSFSKELKIYLTKEIKAHKVRFCYKGQPLVEGVSLRK